MKTLTFIITIITSSPQVNAELVMFYEYDFNQETNRWGLTKECAHQLHESFVRYCKSHHYAANLECTQAKDLSFPRYGDNSLNITATMKQIDNPRRGVLTYVEISDIKACTYDIRNLP